MSDWDFQIMVSPDETDPVDFAGGPSIDIASPGRRGLIAEVVSRPVLKSSPPEGDLNQDPTTEHDRSRPDLSPLCFASKILGLSATPAFALMAFLSSTVSGNGGMDSAGRWISPLTGMATMYLLMGLFHAPPWLRLLAGRQGVRIKNPARSL